jgi:dephospho-CoA kinase
MIKVALTGGIASGKTVFLDAVKDISGVKTLQADELAKEIYDPDNPHFDDAVKILGKDVLTEAGTVALSKVSNKVFQNEELRQRIENISHPYVKERIDELSDQFAKEGASLLVVEIPLLFQSAKVDQKEFDYIVLLSLDHDTQVERLIERDGVSRSRAQDRIKAQSLPENASEKADFVIRSDSGVEETKKEARMVIKEILN